VECRYILAKIRLKRGGRFEMVQLKSLVAILVLAVLVASLTVMSNQDAAAENALWKDVVETGASGQASVEAQAHTGAGSPQTVVVENDVNVSVAINVPNGTVVDLGSTTPGDSSTQAATVHSVEIAGIAMDQGVYLKGLKRMLIGLNERIFERRPERPVQTGQGN
jgi:hypothetical protein